MFACNFSSALPLSCERILSYVLQPCRTTDLSKSPSSTGRKTFIFFLGAKPTVLFLHFSNCKTSKEGKKVRVEKKKKKTLTYAFRIQIPFPSLHSLFSSSLRGGMVEGRKKRKVGGEGEDLRLAKRGRGEGGRSQAEEGGEGAEDSLSLSSWP